jgi:hypothetical protein
MNAHVLANAKAYAALVGSVCTALVGIYGPDSDLGKVLTAVVAVCSAVAVWRVPNAVD